MELTVNDKVVLSIALKQLENLLLLLGDNKCWIYGDVEIDGNTIYEIAEKLDVKII